jgi:hypothetical protein
VQSPHPRRPFSCRSGSGVFLAAVLVGLAAFAAIDVSASRSAIGWPDAWRAPFFFITDYGLSEWVLIPSLVVLVAASLATIWLRGVPRLAAYEVALLSTFVFIGNAWHWSSRSCSSLPAAPPATPTQMARGTAAAR